MFNSTELHQQGPTQPSGTDQIKLCCCEYGYIYFIMVLMIHSIELHQKGPTQPSGMDLIKLCCCEYGYIYFIIVAMFHSIIRTTPAGPNPSTRNGPDKTLLLWTWVYLLHYCWKMLWLCSNYCLYTSEVIYLTQRIQMENENRKSIIFGIQRSKMKVKMT